MSTSSLRSFAVAVLAASALFPATALAGGSVRYSYEKVQIGGDAQWVLVPESSEKLGGKVTKATLEEAFESLRRDKRATYLKSTLSVSGKVPDRAKVVVKIDPAAARFALIIMAETVYTLTELGVDAVEFPGHASGPLRRADIPFSSYALTVPLWKAIPDLDSGIAQVRMPDGSLVPSTEIHDRWRRKDEALVQGVYSYLDDDPYTVTSVARLLPELKLPYVDQVVPLLASDNALVQKTALEILEKERNDKKVLDAVVVLTKAENAEIAGLAADFLGKAKDRSYSVQELFFDLERGDDEAALAAAKALGEVKGDPRVIEHLVATLDDKRAPLAAAAVDSLEALGATDAQIAALDAKKIPVATRLAIAEDLAGDREARAQLAGNRFIVAEGSEADALRAIDAIGKVEGAQARELLEGFLAAEKPSLRRAAIAQLARRAEVDALAALAAAAGKRKGLEAEELEDAGYQIMVAQPLKVVLEQTGARQPIIQRMAYRAAGERAQKEGAGDRAFKVLVEGTSARDARIRGAAARAIGTYANEEAAKVLAKMVEDRDADVRRDVALAIGNFENGEMAEVLKTYLADKDPGVQAAAMDAMARRKEAFAWDRMKELTKASDPRVRASALAALAALVSREDKQGVREVLSMLSGSVNDDSPLVQRAAIDSLGTFKDESAVTAIAMQINADDRDVRMTAIESLGSTGHPAAADLVASVLADPDPRIRSAAIEALGELKGGAAKKALKQRLEAEKDEDVAKLIRATLKRI